METTPRVLSYSSLIFIALTCLHGCSGNLHCFDCANITNPKSCDNVRQCEMGEVCYVKRTHNAYGTSYALGCEENEHCQSTVPKFTLIGRDISTRQISDCFDCCLTHGCNKQFCEEIVQLDGGHNTETKQCVDNLPNCENPSIKSVFCSNITTAKIACRKTCGLCDLVDGAWSSWSPWTICSTTCGLGLSSRTHQCTNPPPSHNGSQCPGDHQQTQSCFLQTCPVHGGWSAWEAWGTCSTSCGIGLTKRHRRCDNPSPSLYGQYCVGDAMEDNLCNATNCGGPLTHTTTELAPVCVDVFSDCGILNNTLNICADKGHAKSICRMYCGLCSIVDGRWSEWNLWSTCSLTCGNGTITRSRDCSSPAPANGGLHCFGSATDMSTCVLRECPVHGAWSVWSDWSTCSTSCGTGLTHRRRTCDNPRPSFDGNTCFGDPLEYSMCDVKSCAVHGAWSVWSGWSTCSTSCGTGLTHRRRTCDNPRPSFDGKTCFGDPLEYSMCDVKSCAVDGYWSLWSEWSSCYCGSTILGCSVNVLTMRMECMKMQKMRYRVCIAATGNGRECTGSSFTYTIDGCSKYSCNSTR